MSWLGNTPARDKSRARVEEGHALSAAARRSAQRGQKAKSRAQVEASGAIADALMADFKRKQHRRG